MNKNFSFRRFPKLRIENCRGNFIVIIKQVNKRCWLVKNSVPFVFFQIWAHIIDSLLFIFDFNFSFNYFNFCVHPWFSNIQYNYSWFLVLFKKTILFSKFSKQSIFRDIYSVCDNHFDILYGAYEIMTIGLDRRCYNEYMFALKITSYSFVFVFFFF